MSSNTENPSIESQSDDEALKLHEYFYRVAQRSSRNSMPSVYEWNQSTYYDLEHEGLNENNPFGGYTSEGTDTVQNENDYKETLLTGSKFDYYCRVFDFGEYGLNLKGKTILDIGSGASNFAMVANYLYGNSGTKVYSLDPRYSDQNLVKDIIEKNSKIVYEHTPTKEEKTQLIAGTAQKLPFKDESMDIVISNFAMTLVPPEQFASTVAEALRVAKDKVELVPFTAFDYIDNIQLPNGVSFRRIGLDSFTFIIDKKTVNQGELMEWLHSKNYKDKGQFEASPDLLEKRKNGYYFKNFKSIKDYVGDADVFDVNEFLKARGINSYEFSESSINADGTINS